MRILVCVLLLLAGTPLFAGESRPTSAEDIGKALARGNAVRAQSAVQPKVLHSFALITTVGGVRCGHALVSLEDAGGEGGAAYRLREQFKAAISDDGHSALIDYSGTFLLGPGLALLSGRMQAASELKDPSGKKQLAQSSATLAVQDDKLAWQRTEELKDGKSAPATTAREIVLHGVRPVPKNALLGLAGLIAAEKPGYVPDPRDAFCVPAIDLNWEMDQFDIEPAWITLDRAVDSQPKGSAMQLRVRFLVGEIGGKGLEIDPPPPQVWQAVQVWALDGSARPLAHPSTGDPRVKAERADPATLDVSAPLDLPKIEAAFKTAR